MIRNATDLTAAEKAAVETLLGRRVEDGEAVVVRTFAPVAMSLQRRQEVAEELSRYFAEVDATRKAVTATELEDAIGSLQPNPYPHP